MMNLLSKLLNNTDKTDLLEQNKQQERFCKVTTSSISGADCTKHLAAMRRIDKATRPPSSNEHGLSKVASHPVSEHRRVITSAYSNALIELLASMYRNRSVHFYLILEQAERLPYLQKLIALSRITLISHHAALTLSTQSNAGIQVFVSIPEFHPKTLTSEYQIDIHGERCIFSSYPWLLSRKQKIPLYILDTNNTLSLVDNINDMYQRLAQSYQTPATNIYSWSRLQSHKVENLEQSFISQVNQLEALLRYIRPKVNDGDLQLTLEKIKHQKTQLLQRSYG